MRIRNKILYECDGCEALLKRKELQKIKEYDEWTFKCPHCTSSLFWLRQK